MSDPTVLGSCVLCVLEETFARPLDFVRWGFFAHEGDGHCTREAGDTGAIVCEILSARSLYFDKFCTVESKSKNERTARDAAYVRFLFVLEGDASREAWEAKRKGLEEMSPYEVLCWLGLHGVCASCTTSERTEKPCHVCQKYGKASPVFGHAQVWVRRFGLTSLGFWKFQLESLKRGSSDVEIPMTLPESRLAFLEERRDMIFVSLAELELALIEPREPDYIGGVLLAEMTFPSKTLLGARFDERGACSAPDLTHTCYRNTTISRDKHRFRRNVMNE